MASLISEDKDKIILDFSKVQTMGPSVFTTLTEVCETLRLSGKEPVIYLPDNREILSAAHKSSFTALFNCTVQNAVPKHVKNTNYFAVVEV